MTNSQSSSAELKTFPELLTTIASAVPEKPALHYLSYTDNDLSLSYHELYQQVESAAGTIQANCPVGERALLLLPTGDDFVSWFVGCLFAGAIATPTAVPTQRREWERLVSILEDAAPRVLITDSETIVKLEQADILPALEEQHIQIINVKKSPKNQNFIAPTITTDMIAFLQYTSGSTGNPKGVMVSHGNLMHNEEAIRNGLRNHEDSVIVSWLPLFHDMGLIGQMLQALYNGATLVMMSPESFLRDPLRWLEAISDYRGTTAGAPNFAYELCVKRGKSQPDRVAKLDLSTWQTAFNGAEPVQADTLDRFTKVFAQQAFDPSAWYPCYGLAECTLFVSGPSHSHPPIYTAVDLEQLHNHRIVPSNDSKAKVMVSTGKVFGDHVVRIVNPESLQICEEQEVGEIWIKGGSVGKGYWNKDAATLEDFHAYTEDGEGPFLRSGDLGCFINGLLYISARYKDMIILNGKNFYPQDIERSAETAHPALRPGCSAAFSIESNGREQLIVLAEVDPKKCFEDDTPDIIAKIRKSVFDQQGASVVSVALYKPYTLFKTSSGKIQRRSCKQAFEQKSIKPLTQWVAPGQVIPTLSNTNPAPLEKSSHSSEYEKLFSIVGHHLVRQQELLVAFSEQLQESMKQLDLLTTPYQSGFHSMNQETHSTANPTKSVIANWLTAYLCEELELDKNALSETTAFSDLGLDSAQAIELCAVLSDWLGHEVSVTELWSTPNISELSALLAQPTQSESTEDTGQHWVNSLSSSELHSLIAADLSR